MGVAVGYGQELGVKVSKISVRDTGIVVSWVRVMVRVMLTLGLIIRCLLTDC